MVGGHPKPPKEEEMRKITECTIVLNAGEHSPKGIIRKYECQEEDFNGLTRVKLADGTFLRFPADLIDVRRADPFGLPFGSKHIGWLRK